MHPGVWFLLGLVTALIASFLAACLRGRARQRGGTPARTTVPPARLRALTADGSSEGLDSLARNVGHELANVSSAIEGHAQLLCEAIGTPHLVASRAERLWQGVHRLRLVSEKLLSFTNVDPIEVGPLRIRPFLARLAREIEAYSGGGLGVDVACAEFLPRALASERALRNAALFLVDTLIELEPTVHRLTLRAFASISEEHDTRIDIELCLESDDVGVARPNPTSPAFRMSYHAARNLLRAQGAGLEFGRAEGANLSCFISLRAALGEPEPTPPAGTAPRVHRFGGVLVLEDDPIVRGMITQELRGTGRNVVTCADGAAARSLMEATPERFELIILDLAVRREDGAALARRALSLDPDVTVLLLSCSGAKNESVDPQRCHLLKKPLEIAELRAALASLLGSRRGRGLEASAELAGAIEGPEPHASPLRERLSSDGA
jgi:CheY-like chemotaxis protein